MNAKLILLSAFVAIYTTSFAQDQELTTDCAIFPTNAENNIVDTAYIDDEPYIMLLPNPETNTIDTVYAIADEMPELIANYQEHGALAMRRYLVEHTQYPKIAKDSSISGKPFVQFVINEKGKIENVSVIRSVHPVLDAEAIRVVKNMPEFEPGKIQGRPVKVLFTIPINFQLN